MKEKKMTKKEVFAMLLEAEGVKGNEFFENFINHQIELLTRTKAERKMTATQIENEKIKETILAVLANMEKATIAEICKADESLNGLSNQKMSALLTQLANDGKVGRETIKRKSHFFITE